MKKTAYQQFLENVERWEAEQKAEKKPDPIPGPEIWGGDTFAKNNFLDLHKAQLEANEKANAAVDAVAAAAIGAARHEENCTCEICFDRPSSHC